MIEYSLVRSDGRAFIFARLGDFTSQIEVDTSKISAEKVLEIFKENEVYPEHTACVYEDLLFKESML